STALLSPDGQRLFIAGEWGILSTQDGGTTWASFTKDAAGNAPHMNFHALTFIIDPNVTSADLPLGTPITLLAGTDGGIWSFDLRTGTSTSGRWADLNSNLAIA